MSKLMLGIVAALMAACATPKKPEPRILSTQTNTPVNFTEPTSYLVRVNFVIFEDEVAQNPNTAKAFYTALSEWIRHLPIECAVFSEKPSPFPFMLGQSGISSQSGIIQVRILDVQSVPYNMPTPILGFWSKKQSVLALDKDVLEIDPDKAYMVALHELGHVFGLPHIVNKADSYALTGWYVSADGYSAEQMIMFPIAGDLNRYSKLTKLEIDLAAKNLPRLNEMVHTDCFHLTSQ